MTIKQIRGTKNHITITSLDNVYEGFGEKTIGGFNVFGHTLIDDNGKSCDLSTIAEIERATEEYRKAVNSDFRIFYSP